MEIFIEGLLDLLFQMAMAFILLKMDPYSKVILKVDNGMDMVLTLKLMALEKYQVNIDLVKRMD
jgi:hypothetical protein